MFSHAHAVFSPGKYIAYEGEGAVFYCTVTVPDSSALGIVRVVVDGEVLPLTAHEQIQRGILLSDHTAVNDTVCQWNVIIAATQTNSNITLGCVVLGYGLSGQATSNIANFKVQGKYIHIHPSIYTYLHVCIICRLESFTKQTLVKLQAFTVFARNGVQI